MSAARPHSTARAGRRLRDRTSEAVVAESVDPDRESGVGARSCASCPCSFWSLFCWRC
ncbi:hypothetical protein FF36_03608 [Frankia torreyi]|uniref:Uncharacterized protein n=1 Tax=Frankia torreyi TaxID=1856 RepID=A0A0D8BCL1_9ACTN|nr:hypothetical protein FF36_03608 [Frankia torreyi]KQM07556.1 hypothetical protein FF86_100243 [Frankia sp. CpI1-P]